VAPFLRVNHGERLRGPGCVGTGKPGRCTNGGGFRKQIKEKKKGEGRKVCGGEKKQVFSKRGAYNHPSATSWVDSLGGGEERSQKKEI